MRIAFTSCFSARRFKQQPVWDEIAELTPQPDVLLLLGDSAYYDVDESSMSQVKGMGAHDFAMHAYGRLREQLHQPQFANLIKRSHLSTYAIWDDHDFLWNGACGAEIAGQPHFAVLLPPTRAAFQAFRRALAERTPVGFPPHPPAWPDNAPPPGYSKIVLAPDVMLHLTDGRSFKTWQGKNALLGKAQMAQLRAQIEADPAAVHLIASGLTFERRGGETWLDCVQEHDELLAMAAHHKILLLSGDIHDNRFASYSTSGSWPLFEATSSGAALKTLVDKGELRRNWGLLDISATQLTVQHFQIGIDPPAYAIRRNDWRLA